MLLAEKAWQIVTKSAHDMLTFSAKVEKIDRANWSNLNFSISWLPTGGSSREPIAFHLPFDNA